MPPVSASPIATPWPAEANGLKLPADRRSRAQRVRRIPRTVESLEPLGTGPGVAARVWRFTQACLATHAPLKQWPREAPPAPSPRRRGPVTRPGAPAGNCPLAEGSHSSRHRVSAAWGQVHEPDPPNRHTVPLRPLLQTPNGVPSTGVPLDQRALADEQQPPVSPANSAVAASGLSDPAGGRRPEEHRSLCAAGATVVMQRPTPRASSRRGRSPRRPFAGGSCPDGSHGCNPAAGLGATALDTTL